MASHPMPEPAPESGAALWLAVGRLQSDVTRVIQGQSEFRTDLTETNRQIDETNRRIDETNRQIDETNRQIDGTNRRIDRLFYAIIGVGGGVIASLVALLLRAT